MSGQSLYRHIRNIRRVGLKEAWHQLNTIGDIKAGVLKGVDKYGNRYFENLETDMPEAPGRHRWVDYAQWDFNASQVPPEWSSWLAHIRGPPPHEDPVVQANTPLWKKDWVENLTGTRGAFKTYNTTVPKYKAWEPKVADRH